MLVFTSGQMAGQSTVELHNIHSHRVWRSQIWQPAGAHSDRVTESHKYTALSCASIMSRPAATARRENNDVPVGPTPALIYLQITCQDADLLLLPRLLHAFNTREECPPHTSGFLRLPLQRISVVDEEKQTKD